MMLTILLISHEFILIPLIPYNRLKYDMRETCFRLLHILPEAGCYHLRTQNFVRVCLYVPCGHLLGKG